jgi:hypothetical protein
MRRKRGQLGVTGHWKGALPHWATPLVLAMLVLRSLIPTGFMLAPAKDGGFAVVLCDADATASLYRHARHDVRAHEIAGSDRVGHDMPAGHHMSAADMTGHDPTGGGHPGGHTGGHAHPDPTCPYAQSSGATPLPFCAATSPATVPGDPAFPELVAQIHAHFGPARQQSPRGPPQLS